MAFISAQKPFAKNNDNGLGKYSFKGLPGPYKKYII